MRFYYLIHNCFSGFYLGFIQSKARLYTNKGVRYIGMFPSQITPPIFKLNLFPCLF